MSNQFMPPQPMPPQGAPPMPQALQSAPPQQTITPGIERVYDLTVGKYDLQIEAGPSYTTRREEVADMITSFIQAAPQTAPVLGPMLAKLSDWPEADKVAELLTTMMPPAARAIMTGQPEPPPGPPRSEEHTSELQSH